MTTKLPKYHFDEYLVANNKYNIHSKQDDILDKLPSNISAMPNLIIYGPSGIGKYTQTLKILKRYSPSQLKYDKKISITINKTNYSYRISDIHYEVDMSLLGCNARTHWHELFIQLNDIIRSKSSNHGIIVCKNFHAIHGDLLDVFYSYMQTNYFVNIDIKFILVTEQVSFIPNNITKSCQIIPYSRPTKNSYDKTLHKKMAINKLYDIYNMMDFQNSIDNIIPHTNICDAIVDCIINIDNMDFSKNREMLYDLLVYNLDIGESVWYILQQVIQRCNYITDADISDLIANTYDFFKYYNNNYRPIFHLEKYIYYISGKIHRLCLKTNYLDIM